MDLQFVLAALKKEMPENEQVLRIDIISEVEVEVMTGRFAGPLMGEGTNYVLKVGEIGWIVVSRKKWMS